jgi:hypothetical protein
MGELFETICRLVEEDRYEVTPHAADRMTERGILEWQVVAGLDRGTFLFEDPFAIPFPKVEVTESLPDGTEFKAVWSWDEERDVARLVTAHFFDRG